MFVIYLQTGISGAGRTSALCLTTTGSAYATGAVYEGGVYAGAW